MKRFIIRSLLFLLPVLAVLFAWEILMRNFPHGLKYKKDVILKKCRAEGEFVFLGNSYTYYGVNTDLLPHAYNLAFPAQTLAQDRFILEMLLRGKPSRLKYAVIPVAIFSFFVRRTAQDETLSRNYIRYWGFPAKKFTDHFFVLDNVPAQLRYVQKTCSRIRSNGIPQCFHLSDTGWGTNLRKGGNHDALVKDGKIAALRQCDTDMENISFFFDLLAMIRLARQHGLTVILYTPPAHEHYCRHLNPEQEKKMRDLIGQAIKPDGVYYLDMLRSTDFTDSDFADPDHLAHSGAKKMTEKLYAFARGK